MKITFLGQAGLLFETENERILVDPYLSDSVAKYQPQNHRRVPVDENFFKLKPSVIVLTHEHGDHTDIETLGKYLTDRSGVLVLASRNAWQKVRGIGGNNNYVSFDVGSEWTKDKVLFKAVYAEHSDPYSIGVVISAEGENYYVTGDTLYNGKVFASLPKERFKAVFLPINGVGNNMNKADAKRFADRLDADMIVPVHFGLFDNISADDFGVANKVIPEIYKEIRLFDIGE